MSADPTPLIEIASRVLASLGWPAIVLLAWKLSGRLTAIETTLNLILTNHLPHLQAGLDELNSKKHK